MDQYKSLLASKTFWGGLAAVVAGVLGLFGYTFAGEDQEAVVLIGTSVAAAIGGLASIYGRIAASKQIKM